MPVEEAECALYIEFHKTELPFRNEAEQSVYLFRPLVAGNCLKANLPVIAAVSRDVAGYCAGVQYPAFGKPQGADFNGGACSELLQFTSFVEKRWQLKKNRFLLLINNKLGSPFSKIYCI